MGKKINILNRARSQRVCTFLLDTPHNVDFETEEKTHVRWNEEWDDLNENLF